MTVEEEVRDLRRHICAMLETLTRLERALNIPFEPCSSQTESHPSKERDDDEPGWVG